MQLEATIDLHVNIPLPNHLVHFAAASLAPRSRTVPQHLKCLPY